ncbi:uncharacterized protein ACNLHF_005964 [Anomaloglossus baeobatrachus]|uniref:uncharacterized protein LOC142303972 n=1 Tax=Anomaloglossus baeobatrachus TaxID=238106 RepID=UPI003F505665
MSSIPDSLLLAIENDGTIRLAVAPKPYLKKFHERSKVVGKLENASHVICSPEGEVFSVRGEDLYRGPMPTKEGVDWFSTARRVGTHEWNQWKILFFHPNGELYGVTHDGKLHKGPQPDNENLPWMYEQSTEIGGKDWNQCATLFFHPNGDLYSVTSEDRFQTAKPPTSQNFWDWNKTASVYGRGWWLDLTYFMAFSTKGKLWSVQKYNGTMYKGFMSNDGRYKDNAEYLGKEYNHFRFLSLAKDKTIRSIISFKFLPEHAEQISSSVEVIEERIYDNRKSRNALNHTFGFCKTLKSCSSFSHDHGFTVEVGSSLTFKAGIPCIAETETTININTSTTNNWSFMETNETEVTFSSTSEVEVPPGEAIRVVGSVRKAELNVPYEVKVRTLFGFQTQLEGIWKGATHYHLMVSQQDYTD